MIKLLSKLSYKNRNKLLIPLTVFFAIVIYFLAIKKTMDVATACYTIENNLALAQDAPGKSARIEKELSQLGRIVGNDKQKDANIQQALLGFVTKYCQSNNIVLREFPKTIDFAQNELIIQTHVFVVEGAFNKLLQLIYSLEQKNKIGKISSLSFQTKKDVKTQITALTVTAYLQNVKKL